MKFDKDDKFIKIGIVAFCTIFALFIACNLVGQIPGFMLTVLDFLDMVLDILSPVIIAFVITYLLLIPTRAIENFLLSRKYFAIKNRSICRGIGYYYRNTDRNLLYDRRPAFQKYYNK